MLLQKLYLANATETVDIRVTDGKFAAIAPQLEALPGEEVVDCCAGKMVLPPFVESHVHLDTCLTAGRPHWNLSGTLFEGIQRWEEYKPFLSKQEVKDRVNKALRLQAGNGIQYVRTHVDINDPELTALRAILELREEVKDYIDIQIVAFPQYGILSYPNGKGLLEEALKMGADAAGAIPHFEFTREYSVESLNICFELAQKYGKLIDVHCDEIYMIRLMRLLKMSGINFVANPCVNVHLGGRADTYPKRRSMTRVKELTAEGINVSFGSDDIFDPWNPLGNANMRDQVFMGLYTGHMLGYEEICNSYKFVTENAARTLHLGDAYGIAVGKDANFIILDAKNWYDALNNNAPVLRNYRKGKLIASTAPVDKKVYF